MEVPTILREARARAGLTQAELAEAAGTSQATVSAYEAGRKRPSLDTFERLLAAAGARIAVETARKPLVVPSARRHHETGRRLLDVLDLAERLPTRHTRELGFPRLEDRAANP